MFEQISQSPEALGQVMGAIIGVAGLVVGTFITILTSFFIRSQDIKRDELKEEAMIERLRKEKEFNLKQEIYSNFISELAHLENFISKDDTSDINPENLDKFEHEWSKVEIKVDLVASQKVFDLKEKMQKELFDQAKTRFSAKGNSKISLSLEYMNSRHALLQAIREDMEIFQN